MKYNNISNTKEKFNLSVAEIDPLIANLDIDELTAGVNRGLDDFKHGRYSHFRTSMERIRKDVFRRLKLFIGGNGMYQHANINSNKKFITLNSTEFNTMFKQTLDHLNPFSFSYSNLIYAETLYYLDLLESFPDLFSILEIPINNVYYRRIVVQKRYLIVYKIDHNFIQVLYFIDARRSPDNMLVY